MKVGVLQFFGWRDLIDEAWRAGENPTERSVDAHVKSLRRKLEGAKDASRPYAVSATATPRRTCAGAGLESSAPTMG